MRRLYVSVLYGVVVNIVEVALVVVLVADGVFPVAALPKSAFGSRTLLIAKLSGGQGQILRHAITPCDHVCSTRLRSSGKIPINIQRAVENTQNVDVGWMLQ